MKQVMRILLGEGLQVVDNINVASNDKGTNENRKNVKYKEKPDATLNSKESFRKRNQILLLKIQVNG